MPACVNPKHIKPGTRSENIRDCIAKGRGNRRPVYAPHRPSKLDERRVIDIRTRVHAGEKFAALANEYGVSIGLIAHIVCGRAWPHVGGPIGKTGRVGRPRKTAASS